MSPMRDRESAPRPLGLCHYFQRQFMCFEQSHLKRPLVRQAVSAKEVWKEEK